MPLLLRQARRGERIEVADTVGNGSFVVSDEEVGSFLSRVVRTDGCWKWLGGFDHAGYGNFTLRRPRRQIKAHRLSYFIAIGPVGEGRELDHVCRNRGCVNPTHLEPVSHRENMLRAEKTVGLFGRKRWRLVIGGTCRNGHEITEDTIGKRRDGTCVCLTCRRARGRRAMARFRARRR